MAHAFVLVDCVAGSEQGVVGGAREMDAVAAAHVVAGDHDAVVEVSGDTMHDLLGTVTSSLRDLDGVEGTRTYVSLE